MESTTQRVKALADELEALATGGAIAHSAIVDTLNRATERLVENATVQGVRLSPDDMIDDPVVQEATPGR